MSGGVGSACRKETYRNALAHEQDTALPALLELRRRGIDPYRCGQLDERCSRYCPPRGMAGRQRSRLRGGTEAEQLGQAAKGRGGAPGPSGTPFRAVRRSGSRPTLAKVSPSERFGAPVRKSARFWRNLRRVSEFALPVRRFPYAEEGVCSPGKWGSLSHCGETPVRRIDRGRKRPFALARLAESVLLAGSGSFIRREFRQKDSVFRPEIRNPFTRSENRPGEVGFRTRGPPRLAHPVRLPPFGGRPRVDVMRCGEGANQNHPVRDIVVCRPR